MHPNEELIRKGYAAFAAGDLDTVRSIFADDIKWHIGGTTSLSGDYTGVDAVFGFFGGIFEKSGGTFTIELLEVLANDDRAVALVRERAERTGNALDSTEVHLWRLADGKAVEFRGVPQDYPHTNAFWS